jgi:hypothetical protein
MKNRLKSIDIKYKGNKGHYKNIKYPIIPLSIDDVYIITTSGDRLDLLANQFYNDVKLWWVIATANRDILRRDSLGIKPGLEIRIPANISKILKSFTKFNKDF